MDNGGRKEGGERVRGKGKRGVSRGLEGGKRGGQEREEGEVGGRTLRRGGSKSLIGKDRGEHSGGRKGGLTGDKRKRRSCVRGGWMEGGWRRKGRSGDLVWRIEGE